MTVMVRMMNKKNLKNDILMVSTLPPTETISEIQTHSLMDELKSFHLTYDTDVLIQN